MKRVEIIANLSVEENVDAALQEAGVQFYTKIPVAYGVGRQGPHLGNAVWASENFVLITWCDDDVPPRILKALEPVKSRYPTEGIKVFIPQ
jgi:nitrogen regulatory protein PII